MKPAPDESSEIEPPMTRALFSTDTDGAEEAVDGADPADPESTIEAASRHRGSGTDPIPSWAAGSVPNPNTAWSSGSGVAPGSVSGSRRGVVGKIEPGQTLYSKYLVLRKLGFGAMGDVWLVRHAALKNEHALKVVVPNFATNRLALVRFQREFEVMATLRHEHAVAIYDACIDDDGGYIDMEFIDGPTIHEVLGSARGRAGLDPTAPLMPLDWVVRILDQLSDVLQVAHQKGIVHRDLKPSNMMLVGGRSPGREFLKVLDFGIAKVRDDPEGVVGRDLEAAEHKTQGFIGTPSYGSPEQAMGSEDIDGRSDLYSVGIMLYEFVTGRLPFRGNHWQVVSQNANTPPPPFAEANPKLRPMPVLEQAIFRVLAKDPNDRPQTARELHDEIQRAVQATLAPGEPGVTPPTWKAFPAQAPPWTPDATPAPTHRDQPREPPLTQADTLIAPPGTDRPRGFDRPAELDEATETRGTSARNLTIPIGVIACLTLLVLLIVVLRATGPDPTDPTPGILGRVEPTKKPVDFETYWPDDYRPVEGYNQGLPWPEKVRRSTDEAVFVKLGDGIYIPESFEPDPKAGLAVDGWPKTILKGGIRFLRMPGGTWVMGAWDDPNAIGRADAPAHPVRLTGYYLQETEVTHGQVEDFLKRVDAATPTDWGRIFDSLKAKMGPELARRYPASNVSRELARRFARWLGGQLPTEAQWEYAARSLGQRRLYVWGDDPAPNPKLARIDADDATPSPVGSYSKANQGRDETDQGILDMAGNLQEMCRDAWISSYIKNEAAALDPCTLASDPDRAPYSLRGAHYGSLGRECATTRRDDKLAAADLAENMGFRLVVECPDTRKPR
jgi:serine/threonine protein kinase/formylglycine-generating enzyme required for sulfatase activity